MKKLVISIVIVAIIAIGAIGYAVKQQANIQGTNRALAEIELALAANERQQMEAQNLLFAYQLKLAEINQRYDAIWRSAHAQGGNALGMANLESEQLSLQAKKYREMIEEQAERLYQLQVEHERLLKQKLELLGK